VTLITNMRDVGTQFSSPPCRSQEGVTAVTEQRVARMDNAVCICTGRLFGTRAVRTLECACVAWLEGPPHQLWTQGKCLS